MPLKVQVKLLKDNSGRVCIHWFQRTDEGKITEPHGLHVAPDGSLVAGPVKGRIACSPRSSIVNASVGGITHLVFRTDDPRAVTCPDCQNTPELKAMLDEIEHLVPV